MPGSSTRCLAKNTDTNRKSITHINNKFIDNIQMKSSKTKQVIVDKFPAFATHMRFSALAARVFRPLAS
jgi:hypothetical protein